MSEKFTVAVDVQVRFSDTDGMRHVNNAVFLSYLEFARMKYWKKLTGISDFSEVDFILARVELDYRSPILPGETVVVKLRIDRIGGSSFDFKYRLEEKTSSRLLAEGRTVQACYDYEKGKVKRMDKNIRAKIDAFEGTLQSR